MHTELFLIVLTYVPSKTWLLKPVKVRKSLLENSSQISNVANSALPKRI